VFTTGAIGIVSDLFSMLVIAIAFSLQWQIALILVLMLFPVTGLIIYFQQQYRKANYKAREELSALNSTLQENIVGINVVQLFRREQFNAQLFRSTNQHYIREVDKTIFTTQPFQLEWIAPLRSQLCCGWAAYLSLKVDFRYIICIYFICSASIRSPAAVCGKSLQFKLDSLP